MVSRRAVRKETRVLVQTACATTAPATSGATFAPIRRGSQAAARRYVEEHPPLIADRYVSKPDLHLAVLPSVQLTACSDGTMCCGGNNTACCDARMGQFPFTGVPINSTSAGHHSKSLSGGAIGGIVVGAVAALLLAAVLVLLLLRFRSDRNKKNAPVPPGRSDVTDFRDHVGSPRTTTTATATMVPSLHSQPSFKGHHDVHQYAMEKTHPYQYPMDRERPLPAVPRAPAPVHELQGSHNTHEVSGQSPWDPSTNGTKS
ncbi:MAG: hypothetical protein Q9162_000277 [Coniocarpon cinnabarinum]